MNEIVVGQSDITASQMKDFWRQVGDGSINRQYLQSVLECSLEKRQLQEGLKEETEQQKIVIPNLLSTSPTLADWLKAREKLHKFFTGKTVILRDLFALTNKELASTALMPAFRPQGATNRMAVDWMKKMSTKVYEETDVMRYTNSKGPKDHELYLINRSIKPDEDTLGENAKTPDQLIAIPDKLWLGLYGWCDADTLHHAITGEHLDTKTWTWFPNDRLPDGKVAYGDWYPGHRGVYLYWYDASYYHPSRGARSAKKVPLTT